MSSAKLTTLLVGLALAGCATPKAQLDQVEDGVRRELAFVVLTDLHVGEGHPAYYGEEDAITARNRAAVAHVNRLARDRGVDMAFVLGDLTGSAEQSEFDKAREILDGLEVPYYPLLGNHDVWPYTDEWEAPSASGDVRFHQTFGDLFEGIDYAGGCRVRTPAGGPASQFQNFSLVQGDIAFIGLDWNTREHAILTYPGAHPEAELHDFPGGTLPWLRERLATLPDTTRRVFFFQHHPFRMFRPVPDWFFTFDGEEKGAFRKALLEAHELERYGAVFSGHLHREALVPAFDEWPAFAQIETAACKETSAVTLVEVFEDGTYRVTRTAPE